MDKDLNTIFLLKDLNTNRIACIHFIYYHLVTFYLFILSKLIN
jgi:hypothetical protein